VSRDNERSLLARRGARRTAGQGDWGRYAWPFSTPPTQSAALPRRAADTAARPPFPRPGAAAARRHAPRLVAPRVHVRAPPLAARAGPRPRSGGLPPPPLCSVSPQAPCRPPAGPPVQAQHRNTSLLPPQGSRHTPCTWARGLVSPIPHTAHARIRAGPGPALPPRRRPRWHAGPLRRPPCRSALIAPPRGLAMNKVDLRMASPMVGVVWGVQGWVGLGLGGLRGVLKGVCTGPEGAGGGGVRGAAGRQSGAAAQRAPRGDARARAHVARLSAARAGARRLRQAAEMVAALPYQRRGGGGRRIAWGVLGPGESPPIPLPSRATCPAPRQKRAFIVPRHSSPSSPVPRRCFTVSIGPYPSPAPAMRAL
jgi:hypothetical protein